MHPNNRVLFKIKPQRTKSIHTLNNPNDMDDQRHGDSQSGSRAVLKGESIGVQRATALAIAFRPSFHMWRLGADGILCSSPERELKRQLCGHASVDLKTAICT